MNVVIEVNLSAVDTVDVCGDCLFRCFLSSPVSSLVMLIAWNWETWSSIACPKAKATKSVQKK